MSTTGDDVAEIVASSPHVPSRLKSAYHRFGGRLGTALAFKLVAVLIVILELLLSRLLNDNPMLQNAIIAVLLLGLGVAAARYMEKG